MTFGKGLRQLRNEFNFTCVLYGRSNFNYYVDYKQQNKINNSYRSHMSELRS